MNSMRINAYIPILKILLMPSHIMKWVLWLFAFIYLCSVVGVWIYREHFNAGIPVVIVFFALYFVMVGMLLPLQALTISSSKSLQYLANFRLFFWAVYLVYSLGMTGLFSLFSMSENGWTFDWILTVTIWTFISAILIIQFLITRLSPALLGAVFFCFFGFKFVLTSLMQVPIVYLLVVTCLFWGWFAYWWANWKPEKFYFSFIGVGIEQLVSGEFAQRNQQFNGSFFISKSKPRSFFGTMLMGMSDSYAAMFRLWFFFIVITVLMFLFLKIIMSNGFHNFVTALGPFSIVFILLSGMVGYQQGLIRNIKRIWLYSSESRLGLLSAMEKHWFKHSLISIAMMPIIYLGSIFIAGFQYLSIQNFLLLVISVLLLTINFFYGALWIYCRNKDTKTGFGFMYSIVMFVLMMVLVGINFILMGSNYSLLGFVFFVLSIIAYIFRQLVHKKWQCINFVRVN